MNCDYSKESPKEPDSFRTVAPKTPIVAGGPKESPGKPAGVETKSPLEDANPNDLRNYYQNQFRF